MNFIPSIYKECYKLGDKIVVANTGDDSLSIIDCSSWTENYRIYMPVGSGPYALAKSKESPCIFVSQYYADSLLYVNLQSRKVEKSLFLGRRPSYMVADTLKNCLYVTNMDSDSVSIIAMDDIGLIGQLAVGSMPQGIDCNFDAELAVANTHSNSIYIISTVDYGIIKTIKLKPYPFQVKYSFNKRRLFVGCSCSENQDRGSIVVFNTDDYSIEYEIILEGIPGQIYETRDGRHILAASMGEGGLQIIDIEKRKVIKTIPTNGMSHGIAVDKHEKYAYVTNPDDDSISIIDWKKCKRITNITVGKEPNGILFISDDP